MKLHRLRSTNSGVADFGCMWSKGLIPEDKKDKVVFLCKAESGRKILMQSRITAYWPDGSVKWTAHCADSRDLGENIDVSFDYAEDVKNPESADCHERSGVSSLNGAGGSYEKRCFLDADSDCAGGIDQPGIFDSAQLYDEFDVQDTDECYVVTYADVIVIVKKDSDYLFESVNKGKRRLFTDAKPVLKLEEPGILDGRATYAVKNYRGRIDAVLLEECGPVRTIFRFEGVHVCDTGKNKGEEKFPFVIRMFIEGGSPGRIRFQHTFLYDGDENKDFLKGIGIEFESPLSGDLYNRHIKFLTDEGLFHETCMPLNSWRPRIPEELYERQIFGESVDKKFLTYFCKDRYSFEDGYEDLKNVQSNENDELINYILNDINYIKDNSPHWDTYSLVQDSSEHFMIHKKLKNEDVCYIDCLHGSRSGGACSFGSSDGSVMISVLDFWQKYPGEIAVKGLSCDKATANIWFYSPSVPSYDFRHYADRGYNQVCYEGYDYKGADPVGIACTSECAISFSDGIIASDNELTDFAKSLNKPQVYVADPKDYHDFRAFGYWSLPSRNTELECWLEDQLENAFSFYQKEVDQRKWYGLFNYGDFMHTYDKFRHQWKYDVGGYAWDNTELVPTLWLWNYFLRTGREDVFDLATKLSRHASEVDAYHIGKYKGLGSRHNVRHWGCPCKEARIAMAHHHRVFYFLTGDRRLEDIFDELKDNEKSFINRDPLGDFYDKADMVYKSHARSGPDWSSLVSNWMTQWERKNDTSYKNKIMTGIGDIEKAPLRLASGPDFEFDPDTCHLRYIGERTTGGTHLQVCMGAPSVWTEVSDLLDYPEYTKMLVELGRFALLPHDQQLEESGSLLGDREYTFPFMFAGLSAFAAQRLKSGRFTISKYSYTNEIDGYGSSIDKDVCVKEGHVLAKRTWKALLSSLISENNTDGFKTVIVDNVGNKKSLSEIPWITTNFTAQWCLNVIMALDFIRDELPETIKEAVELTMEDVNTAFRKA